MPNRMRLPGVHRMRAEPVQEDAVQSDGSFVIWIVVAAIPVALLLISGWARARPPGESRSRTLEREKKPEEL